MNGNLSIDFKNEPNQEKKPIKGLTRLDIDNLLEEGILDAKETFYIPGNTNSKIAVETKKGSYEFYINPNNRDVIEFFKSKRILPKEQPGMVKKVLKNGVTVLLTGAIVSGAGYAAIDFMDNKEAENLEEAVISNSDTFTSALNYAENIKPEGMKTAEVEAIVIEILMSWEKQGLENFFDSNGNLTKLGEETLFGAFQNRVNSERPFTK